VDIIVSKLSFSAFQSRRAAAAAAASKRPQLLLSLLLIFCRLAFHVKRTHFSSWSSYQRGGGLAVFTLLDTALFNDETTARQPVPPARRRLHSLCALCRLFTAAIVCTHYTHTVSYCAAHLLGRNAAMPRVLRERWIFEADDNIALLATGEGGRVWYRHQQKDTHLIHSVFWDHPGAC